MMLVLSLFPGIGLLDEAFELEGFTVVRGPDLLWGGDIRRFHVPPGRFDGVIGGPPCQAFSRLARLVEAQGHKVAENRIPEYERVVNEAQPSWFLMENVEEAPEPSVNGYSVRSRVLNNRWLGEEQNRRRRFSFGVRTDVTSGDCYALDFSREEVTLENPLKASAVCARGCGRATPVAVGGSGKRKSSIRAADRHTKESFKEACRLQGLPPDFDLPPFTVEGKIRAVGNGVPIPMGRAVARCVRRSLGLPIISGAT